MFDLEFEAQRFVRTDAHGPCDSTWLYAVTPDYGTECVGLVAGKVDPKAYDPRARRTMSLDYGRVSDLKWCGMTGKALAAIRAAWKLVNDAAILEKAFGDDKQIVIRSGGKFTVEDYSCGY